MKRFKRPDETHEISPMQIHVMRSDLLVGVQRTSQPMDEFYYQEIKAPYDSEPSIRKTSDIYMLFNQQRLDKLTLQALLTQFENMAVKDSQFSALKSRLSDNDLISIVKSRYIQSPSELMQWSQYLNTLADEELKAFAESSQQVSPVTNEEVNAASGNAPAAASE